MLTLVTAFVAVLLQPAPSTLNRDWGAVLPADQALTFARPRLCNRAAPGPADGTWAPDATAIRQLEERLATELQAAIDLSREPDRPMLAADFYRQYAPLVIRGKRIIYVNGMHRVAVERNSRLNWRTTASHPCDGGMLFFGTEFDVTSGQFSKVLFNGGGRGATPAQRAGAQPADLAELMTKTSLAGPLYSWCRTGEGFAVAPLDKTRRYVVLHADGRSEILAVYAGRPDLSCYSRRQAEELNASIRTSETIEGGLTPRWDTTVVCGFIHDTEAVCWQYSPSEKKFVQVGGWTT